MRYKSRYESKKEIYTKYLSTALIKYTYYVYTVLCLVLVGCSKHIQESASTPEKQQNSDKQNKTGENTNKEDTQKGPGGGGVKALSKNTPKKVQWSSDLRGTPRVPTTAAASTVGNNGSNEAKEDAGNSKATELNSETQKVNSGATEVNNGDKGNRRSSGNGNEDVKKGDDAGSDNERTSDPTHGFIENLFMTLRAWLPGF